MTKKIILKALLVLALLAGVFGVGSLVSTAGAWDGRQAVSVNEDAASADQSDEDGWQSKRQTSQEEALAMPEVIGERLTAYIKSVLRTGNPGTMTAHAKENARRRGAPLLWFYVTFCTILKGVLCSCVAAILFFCLIFISNFHIQIFALYGGDGKKRCPFVFR